MGIFSTNCTQCGGKVKRAARFCSACGAGAPKGWVKCPNCSKWVGNDSENCWNCGTQLCPEDRALMAGGVWQKDPGVLAHRFEVGDIRKMIETSGLQIQAGTCAVLLDGGDVKGVVGPGRYNPESFARKVNHFFNAPPRTAVLIDDGDVVLPLRILGLRTAEEIPVEFYGEVCLRFVHKRGEAFLANLMKEKRQITYEDLTAALIKEIDYAVANTCNTATMEDLIKDPARRLRLEEELADTLEKALKRFGLELVRLAAAEFTGKEYEKLRRQKGDIELKRREIEFDAQLRDLLASETMAQLKSEEDMHTYVTQMAHERGISDMHRDHEVSRLRQVMRHELEKSETIYQMEQENTRAAHEIGIKEQWEEYERGHRLADAQVQDEVERIRIQREQDETKGWAEIAETEDRREERHEETMRRIAREDEVGRAKALAGLDVNALIMSTSDPEKLRALQEVQRMQVLAKGKSPEEILALQAGMSPDAADALKELLLEARSQREKEIEERERIHREAADRLERIARAGLDATSDAARHQGDSPDINVIK